MALALFDMDNTLLTGDSDFEWGRFLVEQSLVDRDEYEEKNTYFFEQYAQGTLDIFEYSRFVFKQLAMRSMDELNELHQQFMQKHIRPMMSQKGQDLVVKHQEQGDTLVVITATNSFIATPIVKAYGIEHTLATNPKIEDGRYTTEIDGTPCFKEGKVTRLNEWLANNDESLFGSIFYSDSFNDLPLLEMVEKPVAVDPDERLEYTATQRGWDIISLRD